ncbi:hypothetical protein KI387_022697, partial [Taxus chinensis]
MASSYTIFSSASYPPHDICTSKGICAFSFCFKADLDSLNQSRRPELLLVSAMGICLSKKDTIPVIFAEEESLFCQKEGSLSEPPCHSSYASISDTNSSGSASIKKELCGYGEISHYNVDSSGKKITTKVDVSVVSEYHLPKIKKSEPNNKDPASVNEHAHRFIDLLDKTRQVKQKCSPARLFPLSRSSSKSTSNSIGLINECKEDAAKSNNIISPASSITVINYPVAADNMSKNSDIEAPLFSCLQLFKKSKEDYAKTLPPMWNIDQYCNFSTKTAPALSKDSKETANDRSNYNGVLGALFNDNKMVDEVDVTARKREIESQTSTNGRLCGSPLIEGEKAFGSPFSVESNHLCEAKEEKTREYWQIFLSTDELSDSSSDLFDIDFQKV